MYTTNSLATAQQVDVQHIGSALARSVISHLANPIRRNLIRTIGYDSIPERELRSIYGRSWVAAQSDLRLLIKSEIVLVHGVGEDSTYSLDLSAFSTSILRNLLDEGQVQEPDFLYGMAA